jgi:hypothetical protein
MPNEPLSSDVRLRSASLTAHFQRSGVMSQYRLKPILDHLNAKFRNVYTPEHGVSVDESLVMWEGQLSLEGMHSFKTC